jgi:acyl dehydratase
MQLHDNGPIGLYYEDYEVGRRMVTRGRTITEADLVQFAALTGDFNPMHTDAVYAASSLAGQRVAHGMLVMSYAVGQVYQLGILEKTILTFRGVEMKFSLPVYIGDTIHIEVTVIEKKDARRLGGGTVVSEVRIVNQDGKVVQKGEWTMLVASKEAQTGAGSAGQTPE